MSLNPHYMEITTEAGEQALQALDQSGQYVAEPKINGRWVCVTARGGRTTATTRSGKALNLVLPPLPDCILIGECTLGTSCAVLKGEVAVAGHDLVYIFDAVAIGQNEVGDLPLMQRRAALQAFVEGFRPSMAAWFRLVPQWSDEFQRHFAEQPEGLVVKLRTDGRYRSGRTNSLWCKVKHWRTADLVAMDATFSEADPGVQPELLAVDLGLYNPATGALVRVGSIGSFHGSTRKELTDIFCADDGAMAVVEIKCRSMNRSGILNGSILRVRDDKALNECLLDDLAGEDEAA